MMSEIYEWEIKETLVLHRRKLKELSEGCIMSLNTPGSQRNTKCITTMIVIIWRQSGKSILIIIANLDEIIVKCGVIGSGYIM